MFGTIEDTPSIIRTGCNVHLCVKLFFMFQAYANVLKGNMDGLKKKDKKSAKTKSKATQ